MTKFATEHDFQRAVAELLDWHGVLWFHPPNGRDAGSAKKGGIWKALGVKAGVPDIMIFDTPPNSPDSPGAAIELKNGTGRPSPDQKTWIEALAFRGWEVQVCRTFEAVQATLRDWGYIK